MQLTNVVGGSGGPSRDLDYYTNLIDDHPGARFLKL